MAAPYNFVHKTDSEPTVTSLPSVSGYNHDQLTEAAVPRDGSSATLNTSTSNFPPTSHLQGYNHYAPSQNSTNSYGYGSTGYDHYYHGYQQQAACYAQQAGTHHDTSSHQQLNSFPHANTSVGPSSYPSTHYDHALYQNTGGYANSGYNYQNNLWSSGSYGNYPYQSYGLADSNGIHTSNSSGALNHHQYQHQNNPWGINYYSQTASDVSCAPGTENVSVTSTPPLHPPVPVREYTTTSSQPLPPGTSSSWKPVPYYPEIPAQINSAAIENHSQSWKSEPSGFLNQYQKSAPLYIQKSQESNQMQYENQYKVGFPPAVSSQYTSCEISQSVQSSMLSPVADTRRANKFQIPTNPRIAQSVSVSMPRLEKETVSSEATLKPAYVSVSLPKTNAGAASCTMENAMLKPGTFPPSLCSYVERALARCKDDFQKIASQDIMKEMITKASADGTLFTKNWDMEPLFALPDTIKAAEKDNFRTPLTLNFKKSPARLTKSRWEPLPEEKLAEKLAQANQGQSKTAWNGIKEIQTVSSVTKYEKKDNVWGGLLKLSSAEQQSFQPKDANRPEKKQRLGESTIGVETLDNSSDSDKESGLTAYYSGALALANSPEEKKRRENRFKRFETVQDHGSDATRQFKPKAARGGHSFGRRATAFSFARSHVESCSRAVEDMDWDALTVKGTCQEIEKRYLRLTSAPDPATVRPEEVLVKALEMVQISQKNYLYKCDQLKSIRQDLTVQRIQNGLTVKVYETHARLALEAGDLPEFNQCQSQLMGLYSEGIEGSCLEFSAYNLLCAVLHANNNRDLLFLMSRLSLEAKSDNAVKHALAVRAAVTSGNYITFFRLYKTAPNLNSCLMDLYVEKMRFEAVRCMSRAYRPTIPVSFITRVLGFTSGTAADGDEIEEFSECEEWLRSHGANLVNDQNGESALNAKASTSSLFMPEPEDAVAHGDATLAVNDFLTRTL